MTDTLKEAIQALQAEPEEVIQLSEDGTPVAFMLSLAAFETLVQQDRIVRMSEAAGHARHRSGRKARLERAAVRQREAGRARESLRARRRFEQRRHEMKKNFPRTSNAYPKESD